MKSRFRVVILRIMLCLGAMSVGGCVRIRPVTIPEVEVVVLDKETRTPIPNMVVYYCIRSTYLRSFLFIPDVFSGAPTEVLFFERHETDMEGKISIPKKRVWMKALYDDVDIYFDVNFDVKYHLPDNYEEMWKMYLEYYFNYRDSGEAEGVVMDERYKFMRYFGFFFDKQRVEEIGLMNPSKEPFENPRYYAEYVCFGTTGDKKKRHVVIKLPRRESTGQSTSFSQ